MRVATALTGVVGAVAGVAVGVVAYQGGARLPEPAATSTAVTPDRPAVPAPSLVVRTRLADCTPPARLVQGVCLTEVERTVVVRDAPASGTGSSQGGDDRYGSRYGEPGQSYGGGRVSGDEPEHESEHEPEHGSGQEDRPGAEHEVEVD